MVFVFLAVLYPLEEEPPFLAFKSHHFFLRLQEQFVALEVDDCIVLFDVAPEYLPPAVDLYDFEHYFPKLVDGPLVALFLLLALADAIDGE